jgi:hypothetical protein
VIFVIDLIPMGRLPFYSSLSDEGSVARVLFKTLIARIANLRERGTLAFNTT